MKPNRLVYSYLLLAAWLPSVSADDLSDCAITDELMVQPQEIFDESEPDINWLQSLANSLHVTTRKETIEDELAFIKDRCELTDKDIAEIKRHLRSLSYINEVNVYHEDDAHRVVVTTTDKWSLMPVLDFSRLGGKNTFAMGIKDRNLWGQGISAELAYFNDVQRSGYSMISSFPLNIGDNIYGSLGFMDTADGSAQSLAVFKPFVSLDTSESFTVSANNSDLLQEYFLNGDDFYELDYSQRNFHMNRGKLISRDDDSVFRYMIGVDYESLNFNNIISPYALVLPDDRHYMVPYIEIQYLQDNYTELTNIHAIDHVEDFNMGWNLRALFGVNTLNADNDEALYRIRASAEKSTAFDEDLYLFTDLKLQADFGETDTPRSRLDMTNELIYRLDEQFSLYAGLNITLSDNEYFDRPITLGEGSGVRGYPLDFQRGEGHASLSTELRYYSNLELFNIFKVGGVVFVDTGKTFKTEAYPNAVDSSLSSVGLGLRLYTPHASHTKVIHIDLAFPTVSAENVGSYQISITAQNSF